MASGFVQFDGHLAGRELPLPHLDGTELSAVGAGLRFAEQFGLPERQILGHMPGDRFADLLVALLPEFLLTGFKVEPIPFIGERLDAMLPGWITNGMNVQFYFGGTSLLIVVGVAMDTVQQIESQLIMRHYDGFMKKSRIRGRRD